MTEIISGICIRAIAQKDLRAVLEQVQALAAHHDDTAQLTLDMLARDTLGPAPWLRVLVAERQDEVLGYAALCPLAQLQFGARGMDIHHLFVDHNWRGRGIGRALVMASITTATELGCRFVTVGTHPMNVKAPEIYLATGFEPMHPPGPRFRIRL